MGAFGGEPLIGEGLRGYREDGVPLWLYNALMYYSSSAPDQKRVDRRLIRMLKVINGRAPYDDSPGEWGSRSKAGERIREQRKVIWALELLNAKLTREKAILAQMNSCPTHGQTPNAWGCPECVVELRRENAKLKAALARLNPG